MRRRLLPIAGPLLGIVILLAACASPEAAEPVATDHVDLPPSYRFEPEAITVPDATTQRRLLGLLDRYCAHQSG